MTRIIISKIRISKIRRKRRRRKRRIREDINNFCLLMTTSLALLLPLLFGVCSININNIIIGFAGSILPGAVIFVDAGAAATATPTPTPTSDGSSPFLRGGGGRGRGQQRRQSEEEEEEDDNNEKRRSNTGISKEYNNSLVGDNNNVDDDEDDGRRRLTSASSSSSYEELLIKMTNDEGIWRQRQQKQQQEQHHHRWILQDSFPEEVYDDDFLGYSSNNITDSNSNSNSTEQSEEDDENEITRARESHLIHLSDLTFGIIASIGLSASLVSIGSCVFVYKYRKHRSVAIGQPPFLYLICFGCILLSSQIYFYLITKYAAPSEVVNDTNNDGKVTNEDIIIHPAYLDANCVGQLWFDNVGLTIIYMSIFCKLWRAYKVTRFRRNVKILPKHVIYPFVVILTSVIVLTIAQTILDPPRYELQAFMDWDFSLNGTGTGTGTITNYGVCRTQGEGDYNTEFQWNNTEPTITNTYDDSNDSNQYEWISSTIFWLQAISILIMLGMAFVVRNIPEDISDSRHVCHSLCAGCYCTCSLWIIWGIGFAFQNLNVMASSRGLIKSFQVYAFVGYLIFPKIYAVCYEKKNGHLPPPRQPRQQHCCSRNKNASSPVVGGRGETRVNGVALPTVPKTKKKRKTLATMFISAFSTFVNDDDDDDNNAAAGISGCDAAVNGGGGDVDDDDDGNGPAGNNNCDVAADISGSDGELQKREHKSSSSSILEEEEEENNGSLSPSPSPSLKDSDTIASIVSEDGIPSKMEDDDEEGDEWGNNNKVDYDNEEWDNNTAADEDDEENCVLP